MPLLGELINKAELSESEYDNISVYYSGQPASYGYNGVYGIQ